MTDSVPPGSTAERDVILQVLDQVCPLQTEFVGPTTLDDILAGAEFKPVQGGSHFNLAIAISLVSCICSLTQLAIKTWELRQKDLASVEEKRQEVQAAISEYIAFHPELAQILLDNAKTPEQVTRTIELVLISNSAGAE